MKSSSTSKFKESLRSTATPTAQHQKSSSARNSGTSTPVNAPVAASRRRTSPVSRLDTNRRSNSGRAGTPAAAAAAGGRRVSTPSRNNAPLSFEHHHETEAEHFWKTTLRKDGNTSPSTRGRRTPTKRHSSPAPGAAGSSVVVEHSYLLSAAARNAAEARGGVHHGGSTSAVAAFSSDIVDPAEYVRIEEMLVTGVYNPSPRIQKLEMMLSRELAMWDHVVGDKHAARISRNDNNDADDEISDFGGDPTSAVDGRKRPRQPQAAAGLGGSATAVSNAALSALMEINNARANTSASATAAAAAAAPPPPPTSSTSHLFSPPGLSVARPDVASPATPAPTSTTEQHTPAAAATAAVLSPPRGNAVRSAAAGIDGTLQNRARERLRMLDQEVAVVDSECETLIADLLSVQKRQQTNDGAQEELNELFAGVQGALRRSQERRERLVALRKQLVAELP